MAPQKAGISRRAGRLLASPEGLCFVGMATSTATFRRQRILIRTIMSSQSLHGKVLGAGSHSAQWLWGRKHCYQSSRGGVTIATNYNCLLILPVLNSLLVLLFAQARLFNRPIIKRLGGGACLAAPRAGYRAFPTLASAVGWLAPVEGGGGGAATATQNSALTEAACTSHATSLPSYTPA